MFMFFPLYLFSTSSYQGSDVDDLEPLRQKSKIYLEKYNLPMRRK